MTTIKHTQGPWTGRTALDSDGLTCKIVVEDASGANICEVSPHGHSQMKGESNARLIAAAPDLLEVVQAMANFDGRNNNAALKEMARAAIAKATGQA
jgi:type VI protein secretion system component VasF